MSLHSDAKACPSSSLTPAMHLAPASPLPTTYLPSLTPFQEPSWLTCSSVLPGKKAGLRARVFREVQVAGPSSPSVAVSGSQHELLVYQEPTTLSLLILILDPKICHIGPGVGLGLMSPDDLS